MKLKDFNTALKKGSIGEQITRRILEAKGWSVFMPVTEGAHHFDMLATLDKRVAIALDVKAKAIMNKFYATGVNKEHFEQYKRFSEKHNMDFWLIFVDESLKEIYGNTLKELEKPYRSLKDNREYPFETTTRYGKNLRLWSYEQMKQIAKLTDDEVCELKNNSQRNYNYSTWTNAKR